MRQGSRLGRRLAASCQLNPARLLADEASSASGAPGSSAGRGRGRDQSRYVHACMQVVCTAHKCTCMLHLQRGQAHCWAASD